LIHHDSNFIHPFQFDSLAPTFSPSTWPVVPTTAQPIPFGAELPTTGPPVDLLLPVNPAPNPPYGGWGSSPLPRPPPPPKPDDWGGSIPVGPLPMDDWGGGSGGQHTSNDYNWSQPPPPPDLKPIFGWGTWGKSAKSKSSKSYSWYGKAQKSSKGGYWMDYDGHGIHYYNAKSSKSSKKGKSSKGYYNYNYANLQTITQLNDAGEGRRIQSHYSFMLSFSSVIATAVLLI